jgi:hypothetical protein
MLLTEHASIARLFKRSLISFIFAVNTFPAALRCVSYWGLPAGLSGGRRKFTRSVTQGRGDAGTRPYSDRKYVFLACIFSFLTANWIW